MRWLYGIITIRECNVIAHVHASRPQIHKWNKSTIISEFRLIWLISATLFAHETWEWISLARYRYMAMKKKKYPPNSEPLWGTMSCNFPVIFSLLRSAPVLPRNQRHHQRALMQWMAGMLHRSKNPQPQTTTCYDKVAGEFITLTMSSLWRNLFITFCAQLTAGCVLPPFVKLHKMVIQLCWADCSKSKVTFHLHERPRDPG